MSTPTSSAAPSLFVPPAVSVSVEDSDSPPASAPTVDLTPLADTVAEYARLLVQIAELKEVADLQRKVIEHALGEREVGLIEGKPAVSWKYVTASRFDVTRFRKSHPDLADEFLTESHSRRFVLRGQ
jgi:predicted phage-related endonuclease